MQVISHCWLERYKSAPCDREAELYVSLASKAPCGDCLRFRFETPIINGTLFDVQKVPAERLTGCDIGSLAVTDRALVLVLTREAARRIRVLKKRFSAENRDQLVALHRPGASALISVMFLADMGGVLSLYDFPSDLEKDAFIDGMGLRPRLRSLWFLGI